MQSAVPKNPAQFLANLASHLQQHFSSIAGLCGADSCAPSCGLSMFAFISDSNPPQEPHLSAVAAEVALTTNHGHEQHEP